MTANNAIVVLWSGNNLPDYLSQKIGELLINNGICEPENITIIYKDSDGVAKSLIHDTMCNEIVQNVSKNPELEAITHSVVYIGKRFEPLIDTNGSLLQFAITLASEAKMAKKNAYRTADENALLSAIEIIVNNYALIPKSLAKEYRFTTRVVNVIREVYQTL